LGTAQEPIGVSKDAVLDKNVTKAINYLQNAATSNKSFGAPQKFQTAVQLMRNKGILKPKEFSTPSGGQNSPVNLAKQVDKLVKDPAYSKLPEPQKNILENSFEKLERQKVLKKLPADTIEE